MRDSKFIKFVAVALGLCLGISVLYDVARDFVGTVRGALSGEETTIDDSEEIDAAEEKPDATDPVDESGGENPEESWTNEIDLTCVEPMSGDFYCHDTIESTTGDTYWNCVFADQDYDGEYRNATWSLGGNHYTTFNTNLAVGRSSRDTSLQAQFSVQVSPDNENWTTIYSSETIKNTTLPMDISGEIPAGANFIKLTAKSDAYGVNCFYLCSDYFVLK